MIRKRSHYLLPMFIVAGCVVDTAEVDRAILVAPRSPETVEVVVQKQRRIGLPVTTTAR